MAKGREFREWAEKNVRSNQVSKKALSTAEEHTRRLEAQVADPKEKNGSLTVQLTFDEAPLEKDRSCQGSRTA